MRNNFLITMIALSHAFASFLTLNAHLKETLPYLRNLMQILLILKLHIENWILFENRYDAS